jgi:hypothetical protein
MPSKSPAQHRLMEAVAHNPAFAKKVGIAQKVGRDFADADKASGNFRAKEPNMARHHKAEHHGKKAHHPHGGMKPYGHESGMSPRKAMASGHGEGGGTFGVEPFHEVQGGGEMHPDHMAHTGMKPHMEDHERGAPPAIHHTKGHLPAQAAPDHGPNHPGGHGEHFDREPMA